MKITRTFSLSRESYDRLEEIAETYYSGNKSMALDNVLKGVVNVCRAEKQTTENPNNI